MLLKYWPCAIKSQWYADPWAPQRLVHWKVFSLLYRPVPVTSGIKLFALQWKKIEFISGKKGCTVHSESPEGCLVAMRVHVNLVQYLVCKLKILLKVLKFSASVIYLFFYGNNQRINHFPNFPKAQLKQYFPACIVSKKIWVIWKQDKPVWKPRSSPKKIAASWLLSGTPSINSVKTGKNSTSFH